jgi:hypothetical protein
LTLKCTRNPDRDQNERFEDKEPFCGNMHKTKDNQFFHQLGNGNKDTFSRKFILKIQPAASKN